MKKQFFTLLAALVIFSACEKTKDETTTLDDSDVVETLEAAILPDEGGVILEIEEAGTMVSALIADNPMLLKHGSDESLCGMQGDTAISKSGARYSLGFSWNWMVVCDGILPSEIEFTETGTFAYNGSRLQNNSSNSGNFALSNLLTGQYYSFSGQIVRDGNSSLTLPNQVKEYSSKIIFQVNEMNIHKEDYHIASGSIDFTMSGKMANGTEYTASGIITFNGDGTITIEIDGGSSYIIEL